MGLFFRLERHIDTRGNARGTGTSPSRLSRVSRGHSPRSRSKGPRRGDHAPRQEQRRAGQRRSSEVRTPARSFKPTPRPLPFFPPNRVSSDGSRPRGRSMDAVGALDPDPAADTASRLPLAPILAVSTADAPLSPRVTRRSGAIFGLVPSTGAPGPDAAAHPGSPGGGFGGSPYGPGGSYGGDTRETQQYTDYQCVHARISPLPPDASRRARCASNQISPTRALRTTPPRRSASSSHHPAFSPPRTGTWVTAGSSARAEAPSSA